MACGKRIPQSAHVCIPLMYPCTVWSALFAILFGKLFCEHVSGCFVMVLAWPSAITDPSSQSLFSHEAMNLFADVPAHHWIHVKFAFWMKTAVALCEAPSNSLYIMEQLRVHSPFRCCNFCFLWHAFFCSTEFCYLTCRVLNSK